MTSENWVHLFGAKVANGRRAGLVRQGDGPSSVRDIGNQPPTFETGKMAHTSLNGISLASSLSLQCPLVRLHGGPLRFATVPTAPFCLSLAPCTNPSFRSALLHFCSGLVSTAPKKPKPFA